jgi:hypothetical protein
MYGKMKNDKWMKKKCALSSKRVKRNWNKIESVMAVQAWKINFWFVVARKMNNNNHNK